MPHTIHAQPDTNPAFTGTTPVPAGHGWLQAAQAQITTTAGVLTITAIAAVTAALATYLFLRRPSKPDLSKHLMYVPLLLVNSAAIYGQVAFFYEQVAPAGWPIPGKLALSVLVAAAIESIAVYVGWHAHDALLNKASATAARLRRASYLLALIVGLINYWHFAGGGMFDPTAASVAFGLLSLLSPWLWGLHTRRAQHVQLTNEGAIDVAGATFSGDRIRMFPYRAYMARRWSIDHYVTDPQQAWQGYNADRDRARAVKPGTRLRAAWLVLAGHADVEPGTVPARAPGTEPGTALDSRAGTRVPGGPGSAPDSAPGTPSGPAADMRPGGAADTDPGAHPSTSPDTHPDAGTGTTPARDAAPTPTRTPTQKRTSNPGVGRTSQPTSAQLKAFKIREQHPGITWAQLAARVGKNERTVRRWFEAARPATTPDQPASTPTPMPTFALPKTSVLAGANGHYPTLTEENR